MSTLKQVTTYIDQADHARLKLLAEAQRVSVYSLVKEAVREFLEREAPATTGSTSDRQDGVHVLTGLTSYDVDHVGDRA